jgi:hypothetical protein
MDSQDLILNKYAKIIIQSTYAIDGEVLEITPTHHIINSKGKIIEVKNENILQVETKRLERINSNID